MVVFLVQIVFNVLSEPPHQDNSRPTQAVDKPERIGNEGRRLVIEYGEQQQKRPENRQRQAAKNFLHINRPSIIVVVTETAAVVVGGGKYCGDNQNRKPDNHNNTDVFHVNRLRLNPLPQL